MRKEEENRGRKMRRKGRKERTIKGRQKRKE